MPLAAWMSVIALPALAACGLTASGCASNAPAMGSGQPHAVDVPIHAERVRVPLEPQDVLRRILVEAARAGHRIENESVNSLHVDLGVRAMRVNVTPPELGAPDTRDTEVHGEAIYVVDVARDGAVVTMYSRPSFWHPDRQVWLRGPLDLAPGRSLLRAVADQFAAEEFTRARR